jgi:hypothetical protein
VIATPTVLVRRELLLGAGLFDEAMQLQVGEDYELFLRLAAQVPFHFIAEDLVLCRQQPDGMTHDLLGGLDQVERVLESVMRRFGVADELAGRALARVDLRRYKQHLLQGYPRDARLADLARALRKDPRNRLARAFLIGERLRCAPLIRAMAAHSGAYAG